MSIEYSGTHHSQLIEKCAREFKVDARLLTRLIDNADVLSDQEEPVSLPGPGEKMQDHKESTFIPPEKLSCTELKITGMGVFGDTVTLNMKEHTGEGARVCGSVAVFGYNGTGKTTIARALRWLLTSRLTGRGSVDGPETDVEREETIAVLMAALNHRTALDGAGSIVVSGTFAPTGTGGVPTDESITIRRSADIDLERGTVTFGLEVFLRGEHERTLTGSAAEELVQGSFGTRFLSTGLFDAEELSTYVGGATSHRLGKTIERATGIDHVLRLSERLRKDARERVRNAEGLREDIELGRWLERATTLGAAVERIRKREEQLAGELSALSHTDTAGNGPEIMEEELHLSTRIEEEARALSRDTAALRRGVPALAREAILTMGTGALESAVLRRERSVAAREARGRISARMEILSHILKEEHCICGDPLSVSGFGRRQVETLLEELGRRMEEIDDPEGLSMYDSPAVLGNVKSSLSLTVHSTPVLGGPGGSAAEAVTDRIRKLKRLTAERDALSREPESGGGSTAANRLRERIASLKGKLAELGLRRRELAGEMKQVEAMARQREGEIEQGIAGENREAERILELSGALGSYHDRVLRTTLDAVISSAGALLGELTNKPGVFLGFEPDPTGGIAVRSRDGPLELGSLSFGERQIAVMALLGGLGHAVNNGLLVIDTPFARLDALHRDHLMARLDRLSPQVILLSTGVEIGVSLNSTEKLEGLPVSRIMMLDFNPESGATTVREVKGDG